MDQSEQSDCDRLSRDITVLLKSISAGEDVDPLLIVMCCELIPPSISEWYDDVLRAMQYTAPVACRPWNRLHAGLAASTANEICSLLLRSFSLKLMPDRPVFFGPSKTFQEAAELFDAYLAADEDSFWYRFETICASANFSQWLIVATMADTERATLHAADDRDELEVPPNPLAPPREYSKPFRISTWHQRFKDAKYSENESDRYFRDWVADQIEKENATRDTQKGPICFDLDFLKTHGVTLPE